MTHFSEHIPIMKRCMTVLMMAHILSDYHTVSILQADSLPMVTQQTQCYIFLVSSGMLHVTNPNLPDTNTLIFCTLSPLTTAQLCDCKEFPSPVTI